MSRRRESPTEGPRTKRRPATTPDGRERQLVRLAVDLAEEQLRSGTASSQVISHYLKLGSSREMLEQERIRQENDLLKAKADQLASQQRTEELYREALSAMRSYSGHDELEHQDYDED